MVSNIFIFTPIWGNDPIWLIFFRWVETTNQNIYNGLPRSVLFCIYSFSLRVDGPDSQGADEKKNRQMVFFLDQGFPKLTNQVSVLGKIISPRLVLTFNWIYLTSGFKKWIIQANGWVTICNTGMVIDPWCPDSPLMFDGTAFFLGVLASWWFTLLSRFNG